MKIDTEKANIAVLKLIDCMMERGTPHFWQGMLSLSKLQFSTNQNDSSDGSKSDVSTNYDNDIDMEELPDQYILSNSRATLLRVGLVIEKILLDLFDKRPNQVLLSDAAGLSKEGWHSDTELKGDNLDNNMTNEEAEIDQQPDFFKKLLTTLFDKLDACMENRVEENIIISSLFSRMVSLPITSTDNLKFIAYVMSSTDRCLESSLTSMAETIKSAMTNIKDFKYKYI